MNNLNKSEMKIHKHFKNSRIRLIKYNNFNFLYVRNFYVKQK